MLDRLLNNLSDLIRRLSKINLVFLCSFFIVPSGKSVLKEFDPSLLGDTVLSGITDQSGIGSGSSSFENKKILVIVPHEDDEICLMGGLMEKYLENGSDIRILFLTNGDFYGPEMGPVRIQEAVSAAASVGIPEESLIFLGYGDQWTDEIHIYNAPGDEVLVSRSGLTETYGTETHPPFRPGVSYTRNHIKEDIRSVIEQYSPDQIFCIDLDGHKDHKAASLLFEEVMGELLRTSGSYCPTVFKGFGYSTSWSSAPDFYSENLLSTVMPSSLSYSTEVPYYRWHSRVRFPVSLKDAFRLRNQTSTYAALKMYRSQSAALKASSVISGDRVFWFRPTTSLLYRADISASSGDPSVLNDFKLVDCADILQRFTDFSGHLWTPDEEDAARRVSVRLKEPSSISSFILYGNGIRNLVIQFDDGSVIETGALNSSCEPTPISFAPKKNVTSFTVTVTETDGSSPGLSELEAYETMPSAGVSWIKLTNRNGDFLYDYWIDESGTEGLSLYRYPEIPEIFETSYAFRSVTDPSAVSVSGDTIRVHCEKGESLLLTAESLTDPLLTDTIRISNPSGAKRLLVRMIQEKESRRAAG